MHPLRKHREAKGWTQDHLATVADVDKRTIQRIENGETKPALSTLNALAAALGADVASLRVEPPTATARPIPPRLLPPPPALVPAAAAPPPSPNHITPAAVVVSSTKIHARLLDLLKQLAVQSPDGDNAVDATPEALAALLGVHWDKVYETALQLRDDGHFELQIPGGYGHDTTLMVRFRS